MYFCVIYKLQIPLLQFGTHPPVQFIIHVDILSNSFPTLSQHPIDGVLLVTYSKVRPELLNAGIHFVKLSTLTVVNLCTLWNLVFDNNQCSVTLKHTSHYLQMSSITITRRSPWQNYSIYSIFHVAARLFCQLIYFTSWQVNVVTVASRWGVPADRAISKSFSQLPYIPFYSNPHYAHTPYYTPTSKQHTPTPQ